MTTWRPGDPLPTDTLWTLPMAAQYLRQNPEVVRRGDCPRIPGRPLTFLPQEVKEYARKRSTAYHPSQPEPQSHAGPNHTNP